MGTATAREHWTARRGRPRTQVAVVPAQVKRPPIHATITVEPELTRLERAQLRRDALQLAIQQLGAEAADQRAVEQRADRLYAYMTGDGALDPAPAPAARPVVPALPAQASDAVVTLVTALNKDVAYWERARVNPHLVRKFRPLVDAALKGQEV